MREARRWCAAVVGAACVLAACSSEPEATAPTVELSTTVVTTLPPTTSTTEAPTTTEDPRIAEVEAAVAAFRDTQVRVLTDPGVPVEEMAEVATGELLENNLSGIRQMRAEGQVITGTFSSTAVTTEFPEIGVASHIECGLDALQAAAADGEVLDPADEIALVRRYTLVEISPSEWLVSLVSLPGSEPTACDAS